jgi:hypothetical protein
LTPLWDHSITPAAKTYTEIYRPDYDGEIIEPIYGCWKDVPGFTRDRLEKAHATYCGEITMVDTWLGYLLRRVENMGLMENTAVIFTSDHGFYFGEHGGLFGKMVYELGPDGKYPTLDDWDKQVEGGIWAYSPLYDLSLDPAQQKDIISEQPDVGQELHQYLVKFMRDTNVAEYLLKPRLELLI